MLKLCFYLLVLLVPGSLHAQTQPADDHLTAEITTLSGQIINGHISRETADSVFISDEDGRPFLVLRSTIMTINYTRHRWSDFGEFGLTIGTPAMFNVVAGYFGRRAGVRFSGLYLGGISGFQLGIPINITRSENTSQDISLLLATTMTHQQIEHDFYGIGPAYELNSAGFYLELGFLFGELKPAIQIGYVHAFR
ncbi:MAG: hypothetical protein Q8922_13120 [Bacteroidota bacterium]|nr:hypothetical protein [Bacteroidota bacterium]MDP4234690.1 hypothetical protein [Bacteroidota bacterium]MDP4243913.1 hypothetical protein [Bacteroidota bacterium]MDP4288864.1 hypothetical protein [Bacteroidota bacterium]